MRSGLGGTHSLSEYASPTAEDWEALSAAEAHRGLDDHEASPRRDSATASAAASASAASAPNRRRAASSGAASEDAESEYRFEFRPSSVAVTAARTEDEAGEAEASSDEGSDGGRSDTRERMRRVAAKIERVRKSTLETLGDDLSPRSLRRRVAAAAVAEAKAAAASSASASDTGGFDADSSGGGGGGGAFTSHGMPPRTLASGHDRLGTTTTAGITGGGDHFDDAGGFGSPAPVRQKQKSPTPTTESTPSTRPSALGARSASTKAVFAAASVSAEGDARRKRRVLAASMRFKAVAYAAIVGPRSDPSVKARVEADVVAAIAASAGIDPSRVKLTGFSQGSLVVHFEIDLLGGEGDDEVKDEEANEDSAETQQTPHVAPLSIGRKSKSSGRWDHLRRLHAALAAVGADGCAGLGRTPPPPFFFHFTPSHFKPQSVVALTGHCFKPPATNVWTYGLYAPSVHLGLWTTSIVYLVLYEETVINK